MTTNTTTVSTSQTISDRQRVIEIEGWTEALKTAVIAGQPKAKSLARIAALALEWLEEERASVNDGR